MHAQHQQCVCHTVNMWNTGIYAMKIYELQVVLALRFTRQVWGPFNPQV